MNSSPFFGMLFKYASDYSEESYMRFLDSDEGLATFQSIAAPDKSDFDRIQSLHPKTLVAFSVMDPPGSPLIFIGHCST